MEPTFPHTSGLNFSRAVAGKLLTYYFRGIGDNSSTAGLHPAGSGA